MMLTFGFTNEFPPISAEFSENFGGNSAEIKRNLAEFGGNLAENQRNFLVILPLTFRISNYKFRISSYCEFRISSEFRIAAEFRSASFVHPPARPPVHPLLSLHIFGQ